MNDANNIVTSISYPDVRGGRTYYRYVFKVGRRYRTAEQLCLNHEDALNRAALLAPEYDTAKQTAQVVMVYPIPAGLAQCGNIAYTGGP